MPPELTRAAEDYLKTIWTLSEWTGEPISTKALAARLSVSASTVSESVRRLTDQGLVSHARYGAIELTEAGRRLAVTMVRRHRLLETYLVSALGYTWDEAHGDAEHLEHAASDLLIERIDASLGRPTRDPHGDPIPAADGSIERPDAQQVAGLAQGVGGTIARISDADPDMLRYFDGIGVTLDQPLEVVARHDYAGVISVRIGPPSAAPIDLGLPAAEAIWIAPGTTPEG